MSTFIWIVVAAGIAWFLAYRCMPLWVWTCVAGLGLAAWTFACTPSFLWSTVAWGAAGAVALALNAASLRRRLVSNHLLKIFRRVLPPMSDTEREALEAGSVWWEAELFRGNPPLAKTSGYSRRAVERGGTGVSRWPGRGVVPDARRLGHHARTSRLATGGVAFP